VDCIEDVARWDGRAVGGWERWQLCRVPLWLRLENLCRVSMANPRASSSSTYQLRPRLRHLAILALVLLIILRAYPALARRRLREAILGLCMGPLLPHLISSVSREVELQGPSEKTL
jgi:hypothetical protein